MKHMTVVTVVFHVHLDLSNRCKNGSNNCQLILRITIDIRHDLSFSYFENLIWLILVL